MISLTLWQVVYNIVNNTHLAANCGSERLTSNRYSCMSPDKLLLGNKPLGDLVIVSGEPQLASRHITNTMRGSLHVTPLGGGRLRLHLRTFNIKYSPVGLSKD